MKKVYLYIVTVSALFFNPFVSFSQTAPNLATAAPFVLFTGNGNFSSDSTSTIVVGDVGNVTGTATGFPPGFLVGTKHFNDAAAIQAKADIDAAYADLLGRTGCTSHASAFGANEILTPGLYCSNTSSSLSGNLTLDAGGNPASVFIIQINGTFSSVAGSQIILTNGAAACNVFWQVSGTATLINTVFRGTMLANGAVDLGSGSIVEGRIFSRTGNFKFGSVIVSICNNVLLPLQLLNFNVVKTTDNGVNVSWITSSEVDVLKYEVETSINGTAFYKVGAVTSKGSDHPNQYSLQDAAINKTGFRFYRLKMIDKNGSFTYSPVRSIKFTDLKSGLINVFPNPAVNTITISVNAEAQQKVSLTIVNMHGQKLLQKIYVVNKGINNFEEDIHALTNASYIVSIKNISTGKESRQNFQKL